MVKVDIISGFLGAGKTTLIQKLFKTKIANEKVALIENEFGEIGVDGAFLKNSGIEIKEINSGCICCSLVGNFEDALRELIDTYRPDRIIIEPSGVGKLSDIISAIKNSGLNLKLNVICTVVDGGKCKMYLNNFGEFYIDQIREANTILLSKTDKISEQKVIEACELIKTYNPTVTIITTPIFELDGEFLLENLEETVSLVDLLIEQVKKEHHDHEHHHHEHEHHHHDHEDGEECCCGHHHDHEHHHHDHEDGEECCCGHHHDHEHHHHDHECSCGCHGHHHHDADEVFASYGEETPLSYTRAELTNILSALKENILRSKGVVKGADTNNWYYFDFVAGDYEIREGEPDVIGKFCVIGTDLNKQELKNLFLKKV